MASWRDAPLAEAADGGTWCDAPLADAPAPAVPNKGSTQAVPGPSMLERAADMFTGSLRTEFPDAPEFGAALSEAGRAAGRGTPAPLQALGSLVTPDPRAQVDILRRGIPDLEERTDTHGNIMLRAPGAGVTEWTYLNKPGVSARDVGETLFQTVPFLATGAGALASTVGRGLAMRAGALAGTGAATSAAQDVAAIGLGSEQDVDVGRAALAGAAGGVTAPGVPSALARGVARTAAAPFRAATSYVQSATGTGQAATGAAERAVARAFEADSAGAGAHLTPDELANLATTRLTTEGAEARLMDIGGERTRALARSAANTSPEARGTLQAVIEPRFATQSERTTTFLEGLFPGKTANQTREALQEMARAERGPLYQAAYQQGAGGVWNDQLAALAATPAMEAAIPAPL